MTLEFLICTIDDGMQSLPSMLLPPQEGVQYLISWQHSLEAGRKGEGSGDANRWSVPESLLQRSDVRVVELEGRGLSRNRNHALRHAQGDWLILADDDCTYTVEGIARLRSVIAAHPDAAILQLQGHDALGNPLRAYPSFPYEYRLRPRFSYVCSWELVLRRTANLPWFDERFGIGAYLGCGEEEVFVHECSQRGEAVYYEPVPWVTTDAATTGTRFDESRAVQRAKGGVLAVMHGAVGAVLRCTKFAFTYSGASWLKRWRILFEMYKGIVHVYTHHPIP